VTTDTPEWRPAPGYEGLYDISNTGLVWSRHVERPMSPRINPQGYRGVNLSIADQIRSFLVHRLVMAAFVGPCPEGMVIRHLDGDPSNNSVDNLRYGTYSENAYDRVLHGRDRSARKTHCPQGHPYDEVNTRIDSHSGARRCRACRNAYQSRRYHARKAVAA
jgi:hypothetical protein